LRIAVIGLGLIGGSVALAAREGGAEVVAWDVSEEVAEPAFAKGIAVTIGGPLDQVVAGADVVFLAAPVGVLPELLVDVLRTAPAGCVVTDVGSTKRPIVAAAAGDERFVGGHPLAGAETAGVGHAREDLFKGAVWYLTPTVDSDGLLYERLHRLISSFGAQVAVIEPEQHDQALALVSHLPHVLANVLVSQTADVLSGQGERLPATGPSFRDLTRVAGANSGIWGDIYLSNRDALVEAIDDTVARLQRVRSSLASADRAAVVQWNDRAAADRRRLLDGQLSAGELNEIRVSVPNRPGVVAELALELGRAGVNIADMALHPAPDMASGVVILWIAGAAAADKAEQILVSMEFPVFRA
jgi:prephenate dehydrogenase